MLEFLGMAMCYLLAFALIVSVLFLVFAGCYLVAKDKEAQEDA